MLSPARHRRAALALAVTCCLAAGATEAQQPPKASSDTRHATPEELDEVVVYASPLRQSRSALAQPIEVLTGEALDRARASTLGETIETLPGVQSSNFGPGVGRPIIRGLDGPRVATLSGGLATQDVSSISQDHAVGIEPFLADQIEVLKGPSTLLYGSGAIGGAVNVVDGRIAERAMADDFGGRMELRGSSVNDGFTGMARVDANAAGGSVVLHADGALRDQGDYDTPNGRQLNSFVESAVGGIGASLVGDLGFIGVSVSDFQHDYGNPGEPGDPDEGEAGVSLELQQQRYEVRGGLTQEFGIFSSLRASVARTDYEHTEFEGDEVGTLFFNDATEGRVELEHRAFGPWRGALGLQALSREFEAIGDEAFVPQTRTRSHGLFLVEEALFGALQLDLGARTDRVESDAAGIGERSFSPLSLSAGALWRFDERWRVGLNLDRAERAPVEEELFANGPHVATASFEIGDPELGIERANQVELGLHYVGDRFQAKASVYRTQFDGFIYLLDSGEFEAGEEDEEPLPIRLWTQDDATFRGFELEASARLLETDAGQLSGRLFLDSVNARLDSGGNLPRIAPARVGAELAWNGRAWDASLGATRVAAQNDVAIDESRTDGYTLVNAQFSYHFDLTRTSWELFLKADNLTDRTGRVHTSFLRDSVVLPGRNVSAGVRLFF